MDRNIGKYLEIDLDTFSTKTIQVPEEVQRQYIGGSGMGTYFLRQYTPPSVEPLSAKNTLIFASGPLTGTPVPLSGRSAAVAKSPLTGIFGEATVGGAWGKVLRHTGWDGVILRGRAKNPTALFISEEGVRFIDAAPLWGLDSYETASQIATLYGQEWVVSCIGQAGEKCVPMACIMNDGSNGRPLGRSGLGAVMGSKNLKAVAVKGNRPVQVAHLEELRESVRQMSATLRRNNSGLTEFGTASGTVGMEASGDMPNRNWKGDRWPEGARLISGMELSRMYLKKAYYCAGCIVGCGRDVAITEGPHAGVVGAGPEYETVGILGSLSQVDDLAALCHANELCNRYGIDTISAGGAIAFAREAFEKGLLKGLTDLDLSWGNAPSMLELIRMIGEKRGVGELLGKGVRQAAQELGGGSEEFAMHVKGMEMPAHDPRAFPSVGLGYATSNRGACHLAAWSGIFENRMSLPSVGYPQPLPRFTGEGKAKLVYDMQNVMGMFDSLALCKFLIFGGVDVSQIVQWVNLVLDWEMTMEDFLQCGERIFNAKRLFNVACGISRKDDTLPQRILTLPKPEGDTQGFLPPLEMMLEEYYQIRGWDEEGAPTRDTRIRLSL
jgi:aldehyde:ferredoxin oxidoreductase